ncbi:hypothetical protein [Exiguobacterium sp. s127]|uniref:hypothetical protein n=1 Tax=Exiguobacterium sp. s127 TaxID=2751210 RepID=UPI001BEBFC9C|nr:hypothetical protein [Exiguobacterium sp. s127]
MASITVYRIIQDLFFFEGNELDLESLASAVLDNQVGTNEQGVINESGFTIPTFNQVDDINYIEFLGFEETSYGVYSEPSIINNRVRTIENTFKYFTSCRVLVFSNNFLVILSNDSGEEKVKVGVRKLLEGIGLSLDVIKMDSDFLTRAKNNPYITCTSCTINEVNNENDSTRNVSYEVDPADIVNDSIVSNIYEGKGHITKIKALFPYQIVSGNVSIVLTLYKNGNRCSFEPLQLNGGELNRFILVLMEFLAGN